MAGNIYGINKWLFVVTSFLGIFGVLSLSCITESKFIAWCGKNLLIIFITHFGTQKLLIAIWRQLGIHNYMEYPYYFIMFILLLVVEVVLLKFINWMKFKKV